MTNDSFVPLPGSERGPVPGIETTGPVDGSARIEVTLITRRRAELPRELVLGPDTLTPAQMSERHGTDPDDSDLIREVLAQHGIEVTQTYTGSRCVKASGTLAALAETFGASLSMVRSDHPAAPSGRAEHRYREGSLRIPAELDGIVLAVLGLDDRPQVKPHFRIAPAAGPAASRAAAGTDADAPAAPAAARTSYTPPQIAELYQFPAGTDGTGQGIAILEFGGGFASSDLDSYFSGLGIAAPSVTVASIDGAVSQPGQDPGSDGEVLLDIEVAGSVAPGAAQIVYFAPNTDQGFVDAVSAAVHARPTPAVVSISWGAPEDSWTAQSRSALDDAIADAAALGITVCAAAGDKGSSDGQPGGGSHTDFPASSPHVLACGGTSLRANAATGTITSETVWNDGPGQGATGGGVSAVFPVPSWQTAAGVPVRAGSGSATGRGVPDVAGNADPATGYQVLVDGQRAVFGGTSAVAPLWSALLCRLAQAAGKSFGLLQPLIYAGVASGAAAEGFRDITSGNNGAYAAGPGWDACTGLGAPDGTALLARLSSGPSAAG